MNALEAVEYYCQNSNISGALLIDGDWGSGKTYFIDNVVKKSIDIKEKLIIIKVSLFDVKTEDSLLSKIVKAVFSERNENINKFFNSKFFKALSSNAKSAANANDITSAIFSLDPTKFFELEKTYDEKTTILVLDDLERCSMDFTQLLGLINEYVENKGIKVILLANEEYITKDNDKCKTYMDMKEKIVSQTIKYQINCEDIVEDIIENYKISEDSIYRDFLYERRIILADILEDSGLNNIRSLKCVVNDFERVYDLFVSRTENLEIVERIFVYFAIRTFEEKAESEKLKHPDSSGDEFTSSFLTSSKYRHSGIAIEMISLLSWIKNGKYIESDIEQELEEKIQLYTEKKPNELLREFDSVLFIEDETFEIGWAQYIEDVYLGKLQFRQYKTTLKLINSIVKYQVPIEPEIDYGRVKYAVKESIEKLIDNGDAYTPVVKLNPQFKFENDSIIEIAKIIMEFDDASYLSQNKYILKQALLENNYSKVHSIMSNNTIIYDKEILEVMIDYYNRASNNCKLNLCYLINEYKFPFSSINDYPSIVEYFLEPLKEHLKKEQDSLKQISKAINILFIENIESIIALRNTD